MHAHGLELWAGQPAPLGSAGEVEAVNNPYDAEARQVSASFSPGRRLVVIGSTSFWGSDSRELCQLIAAKLAGIEGMVVVTGGMEGVGQTLGEAYAAARRAAGRPEHLYHLLPRGMGACDSGVTLGAGIDYHDRREVLGRVGHVYLVMEGGPATAHEAAVAGGRGVTIIPLARTGGHARELYPQIRLPVGAHPDDWALLADADAPHGEVVSAVRRLVHYTLGHADEQGAAADGVRTQVSGDE